jgi:CcmD family protein
MTPDSKLFVVIIVLAVIMTGIYIYLFSLDRKIGRMEKEIEERKNKPNL